MGEFLLIMSILGLLTISFCYAFYPVELLNFLGIKDCDNINLRHIFKSLAGLSFGLTLFLVLTLCGVFDLKYGLTVLAIFMLSMVFGRIVSLIVDGSPHVVLNACFYIELALGGACITYLIRSF